MSEFLTNSEERSRIYRAIAEAILAKNLDKAMAQTMQPWIDAATPADIARLVDEFVAEGLDFSRLKPLVAALLNLFRHPLEAFRYPAAPVRERFLASLVAENRAVSGLLESLKPCIAALAPGRCPNPETPEPRGIRDNSGMAALRAGAVRAAAVIAERLSRMEILFRKKENILFPRFESRFPEYRCVRLMWSIQDDVRRDIAEFRGQLSVMSEATDSEKANSGLVRTSAPDTATGSPATLTAAVAGETGIPPGASALSMSAGRLFFDLSTLVFRDECILYPLMAALFDENELEEMFNESLDFGMAFLTPDEAAIYIAFSADPAAAPDVPVGDKETPPSANSGREAATAALRGTRIPASRAITLGSGSMTPEALAALLRTIPQDMTFVDANDRVAFFTDSPRRIFPRSRSIIGRKVADCHPHESADRVMSIVDSFRSGEKDRESFWLTRKERFVHIEYRALRSPEGDYLGTLEISEDLTDKRALSGEKRL